jgi:hypothetical protein
LWIAPQVREFVPAAISHRDDVIGLKRIARDAGLAAHLAGTADPGARSASGPPQQIFRWYWYAAP